MYNEPWLPSFPAVRTRDVDELRRWLSSVYSVHRIEMPGHDRISDCVINHCNMASLAMSYASYGSTISVHIEQNDFFVQGFPLRGTGQVRWNKRIKHVQPSVGGIVGNPGSHADLTFDNEFSHLVLKISVPALTRRLSLLVDRPVDPPLALTGDFDPSLSAAQFRLVAFLAQEVERTQLRMPDIVLAELEDAVLLSFLLTNRHNYSHLLEGSHRPVAPWQVRRAVDFIEQHWGRPITIEKLCDITETSARSLFHLFKKTYDVSPMVYLSKVRLRHAHELLSRPEPGTSVTKVGFICGFSNLGKFALKYFAAYGEKPSDTLKNHLR